MSRNYKSNKNDELEQNGQPSRELQGSSKNNLNRNGQMGIMADRGGQARPGLRRHQEVITADFMEEFAIYQAGYYLTT